MTHNQNLYTHLTTVILEVLELWVILFDYFLLSEYFRIIFCYIWEKFLINIILKDKEVGKKKREKERREKTMLHL